MPIVLFLTKEKEEKKDIKINWENYEEIEPRLIYIYKKLYRRYENF